MSAGDTLRARVRRVACTAGLLAALAAPLAHAQTPVPLNVGETRTAAQHATDRFRYDVAIDEPGAYLVRVEQRGLDLIVSVEAPAGSATSFNSPLFRDGAESVLLDAEPGRYRVDLRSEEHTGAAAAHAITIVRLAPGTDTRELEAWRSAAMGAAANFAGGEQGWTRAVDSYERAAALWRGLGRAREEADAEFAAATIRYWQLFDWDGAIELAARVAAVYSSLGEAALAANAQHLQGAAIVEQALEAQQSTTGTALSAESEALFAAAFELLEEAREVHERLGNIYDLGLVLNNFGYTYYGRGDFQKARRYYEEAAVFLESVAEWGTQVRPVANIAVLDAEAGQLVSAAAAFERVLELTRPNAESDRASALGNLGTTQRMLGNFDEALQAFAASLALHRKLDNGHGEARALLRIGATYFALGELELARQYLLEALPLAERANDGRTQEGVHRNLGNVAFLERDYEGALERHRRALAVSASVSDRAHLQILIAKDLVALGRGGEAKQAAAEAEAFAAETDSDVLRAGALSAAGRALLATGDTAAAAANLAAAAELFDRLDLRSEHADALHGLALVARAANRTDEAIEHGAAALREVEALRARVADPELRASFAAARRDYYEAQIDLLMTSEPRAEHVRAALAVSERGRARMIADLLQEAAVDLRHDVDPALHAKRTALYEQLAERRHQRDLALEQPAAERDGARLTRTRAELASLENALDLLEIEVRRGNPRFASLTAPDPLTPEEMQARLDADTVVLQYALGARASYVWVVTEDVIEAVELRDRATLESAARRAIDAVAVRSPGGGVAAQSRALDELAALVLAPVAARITQRRVVLALDGALQYVPFGVLPVKRADGATERLVDAHEVTEVPSLSALSVPTRDTPRASGKTLAVFADPVLEASDPRLGAAQPQSSRVAAAAPRTAIRTSPGIELSRLLSTSYEAQAIADLVPADRRLLASGFAASRAAVLDSPLADFRYIHFATHGLVDSRYPGLSALVLSQFDERGATQDGYLRLNDIYNLRLDADLVVLSACDTALGREVRGEGLIGLTQGFMAAGARSLVASLWQVPDRATAELMARFYGHLLNDGLRPAEALRRAQLWAASEPRYRDPYFWGGFVLVGDWR
jgi:CHAT domain-containing protein/tetratricopeptide (TPR) repeat protein